MSDIILVKLESIGSETDDRGLHPPFSILYLADSLEKAGFTLRLVHEEGTPASIQALVDLVSVEKPSFVGFSVVTGPQLIPSLTASGVIKDRFDVPIIWGGLQPTLLPEKALEKSCIDLLVLGEGEDTIVELSQNITKHGFNDSRLGEIPGIAFKKNGKVMVTSPRPFIRDLDSHHTAWHYLDIERYIRPEIYFHTSLAGKRSIAVNTSRGCPWRCGYCYNQGVNKRTFRAQTAERVLQEIQDLKRRYDISAVRFSEDYFFSNRERALKIIRNVGLPWNATIRVDDLARGGDSFARDLAENQCALLRCGVESGSQRVLDLIQKDITIDEVRRTADLCDKHGIRIGFFFMLGFPGESWAEVCETLDLMDELEARSALIMTSSLSLFCAFPGTVLLDLAIKQGYRAPLTLEQWGSTIDVVAKNSGELPPYVDRRVERAINYQRLARFKGSDQSLLAIPERVLRGIAKLRWKYRFFSFPIDWYVADFVWSRLRKPGAT